MKVVAVVDRFEGNKAILLLGDEEIQVIWPRKGLPAEVKETDILTIDLQIDAEATCAAQTEAERLLKEIMAKNEKGS
jgi:hypothetical protein